MRSLTTLAALVALTLTIMGPVRAGEPVRTPLKPFNVTIRVFDPTKGIVSGHDYVLPVDSPDAEHAIASTTVNVASFTRKTAGGTPLPVTFTCIKVEPR